MLCKALPRGSHRGRREACAFLQHFEHSHQTGSVHQSSTSERQIFLGKLPWASWAEQCPEGGDQKAQEPRPKHRTCPSNKAFHHSLSTWARTARLQLSPLLFHDCYVPLELHILWHFFIWDCTHTCLTWDRVEEVMVMQEQGAPPLHLKCSTSRHSWLSHLCNIPSEHGWRIGVVFISWQPLQQPNPSQFAFSWARPILAVYVRKVGWVEWSFSQVTFLFNVTFPLTEHKFLPLFICVPHWLGLNSVAVSGNYWHLKCWLWGYWN